MFPRRRYRCQIWLCRTRLLRSRISWPLQFRPVPQHSCQPVKLTTDTNAGHGSGHRGDGAGGHTMPMNGANLGESSESAIIVASLFCSGAQELEVSAGLCLPSEMCLGGVGFEVVSKAAAAARLLAPTAGRRVLLVMMMMKLGGELHAASPTPGTGWLPRATGSRVGPR